MAQASDRNDPAIDVGGIGLAVCAYLIWGLTPIYWKLFPEIPATQVLIPRVGWTALLLVAVALFGGRRQELRIGSLRGLAASGVAAILLATNWGSFIWAVQSEQVIATSLGYYINPLMSVLLGLVILRERMSRAQALAVAVAAAGVGVMALQADQFPWISLVLAGSFALYGLIHKLAPQPPFGGLAREMLLLLPLAAAGLFWLSQRGEAALLEASTTTQAWLSLSGFVTAAPLLLFHAATKRLPLFAIGMLQYIAPTLTLLLAVAVYGEAFTTTHGIGFGFVWTGLAIFSIDSLRRVRRMPRA